MPGGTMGLAVAIQMDPIDTINIDADSTFALALEAQRRGHALHHYLPQALTLRDGGLYACGRLLEVFRQHGNHHRFGDVEELDLARFDIVLMRQDPQFDVPEVRQRDKRIILVEGEPVGAVLRVPPEGEARANLHVGGRALKTKLTRRERDICAAIGPSLREQGLVFVGIDVLGDYITEINVTSPTGIQEIARLDGVDLAVNIWDAIEARFAARANRRPA